jgi:hypothetical protein
MISQRIPFSFYKNNKEKRRKEEKKKKKRIKRKLMRVDMRRG